MATPPKKTVAPQAAAKKPAAKAAPRAKAPPKAPPAEESLRDQAAQFRDTAREKVKSAASSGKDKASEAIGGASSVIEDVAATLDEKLGVQYGDYARKAAGSISDFADTLKSKNVDDLLDGARDFVRKKPAVAIGAAAAIGFLLTRLIRADDDEA